MDGSEDFYRGWSEQGFGNVSREHWIGNDNIHALTAKQDQKLKVELQYGDETAYANYNLFWIDDRTKNYKLTVAEYTGTAGVFPDYFTLKLRQSVSVMI